MVFLIVDGNALPAAGRAINRCNPELNANRIGWDICPICWDRLKKKNMVDRDRVSERPSVRVAVVDPLDERPCERTLVAR